MMLWKKVTLTDEEIAAGGDDRLQEAFWKRFIGAGAPHDAVTYGNEDITEGHHFFFFTQGGNYSWPAFERLHGNGLSRTRS